MSSSYRPPSSDLRFVLDEVLGYRRLFELPAFAHADATTGEAVLAQAARFAGEVLAPLNAKADQEGCALVDGRVRSAPGFREAYARYVEGGWPGIDLPVEFGGQALPLVLQAACAEMFNGACVAFGMLPLMERAATRLLVEHAPRRLVDEMVPRLASGHWGATICISEPEAGSDVGRSTTRAEKTPTGTAYRLSGTKIFISYGDHDLTPQIVHLVLARVPGAPAGTRGLSLFAVPSRRIERGEPGQPNGVNVLRLEPKMGLKASPTCVLEFDGAEGYLIGRENEGLKAMFTMVNTMRLEVAVQGVAVAGAATHRALDYAVQRRQGGRPDAPPVPIVEHADVRRMLYTMRARTETMRALVLETALQLDLATAAESGEREDARALAEWLLPVCKACGSEAGFAVANLAVQVFGGHGYIRETGVEQYVRDSRVMAIYEGANGIQALDLVTRKLGGDGGRRYEVFRERIRADVERLQLPAALQGLRDDMVAALRRLDECTAQTMERLRERARDVEAGATDYLQLVGCVAGAWMWLRMAAADREQAGSLRPKAALARFYFEAVLPESELMARRALAGAETVDLLEPEALARVD